MSSQIYKMQSEGPPAIQEAFRVGFVTVQLSSGDWERLQAIWVRVCAATGRPSIILHRAYGHNRATHISVIECRNGRVVPYIGTGKGVIEVFEDEGDGMGAHVVVQRRHGARVARRLAKQLSTGVYHAI